MQHVRVAVVAQARSMEECKMAKAKKDKEKEAVEAVAAPSGAVVPSTTLATNGEVPAPIFQGYEGWADLSRENFAAVVKANAALSEGLEAIGKEVFVYARRSFEQAAETATALLGAKTIEDVLELNTALAKANIAGMIERSAKLSELSIKVANETLAPLGGRVEATISRLSKPLAA
jgi:hypothetical protein